MNAHVQGQMSNELRTRIGLPPVRLVQPNPFANCTEAELDEIERQLKLKVDHDINSPTKAQIEVARDQGREDAANGHLSRYQNRYEHSHPALRDAWLNAYDDEIEAFEHRERFEVR